MSVCSVMELPNLHPHPLARPEFLVADSWFVITHPSLQHLLSPSPDPETSDMLPRSTVTQQHSFQHNQQTQLLKYPLSLLIYQKSHFELMSPGVDVADLQHSVLDRPPAPCPRRCGSYLPLHSKGTPYFTPHDRRHLRCGPCFTVGMMCRLAPEKSVGLFLLAAAELVHTLACTACRFVLIGDGKLRPHLERLTRSLDLMEHVHFAGWLTKEEMMVRVVSTWDVAVTTGAWRETFSIAGLELLALGVPLVTFASGGMGEYIVSPLESTSSARIGGRFSIGCRERVSIFLSTIVDSTSLSLRDIDHLHVQMSSNISLCPFAVTDNAIVVHNTHPQALALAVKYVEFSAEDRKTIGYAGMLSASRYFHMNKTRSFYQRFLLNTVR